MNVKFHWSDHKNGVEYSTFGCETSSETKSLIIDFIIFSIYQFIDKQMHFKSDNLFDMTSLMICLYL